MLFYIKGENNHEADALSRLSISDKVDIQEIMLNHPPDDPYFPANNIYPLEIGNIFHHQ